MKYIYSVLYISFSDAMVFEESESLGSVVSGQQSPEPADQSKASVEDTGGSGGGSAGGVLAGGSVVVTKPGRMESGKKLLRERTSIFSISRVTSRSSSATAAGSGSQVGSGENFSRVTVNTSASTCSSKILSTFTQDHSSSPELKANTPAGNTSIKGNFNCATNINKPSRRTTSLLNLFVASTSSAGMWLVLLSLCI